MVSPSVSHPTGWRKKLAKAYRNILLAASDSQSLLSMAYWVNFYIKGKCELSAYHYRLAIDIGLISCSSFISSTLMIRNYYKKPITAILRYMIISTVFGLLGILIFYQRDGLSGPEQWPKNRKTSAILLPASCFLDPDFHVFQGNTSQKIRDQIGNPDNTVRFPMIFWIMDLILLIFSCIKNLYQSYFDKVHPEAADYPYIWRCLTRFYKVLAFLILFATSSIAWTHILWLLVFVNDSGWIKLNSSKTNPERTFSDIGQLISLFSMFSILISFSQLYKWLPEQDSTADEELQNYGRGQWQEVSSYNDSEILARSDDNSQPPSMEGFANISVDAIRATHPRTHIPPKPRWEGTVTWLYWHSLRSKKSLSNNPPRGMKRLARS